ncbi:rolling circle replication-associated protein [Bacillus cereus group sp. Bce039]|uniref:rolling circle replication-associated protein n=1 Tax=Bacillus cereus group sp. Bce039 TaxID=3445230 RepID=UPI003F25E066
MRFIKKLIKSGNIVELYVYGKSQSSGFSKTEVAKTKAALTREINKMQRQEIQEKIKSAEGLEKEKLQELLDDYANEVVKRRGDNLNKTRRELRRLINANTDTLDKFITLTFKENVTDVDEAHKHFRGFVKRMRRKRPDFQYACVVEFQKRGAVHYHLLSNLKYMKKADLAAIWNAGFVQINRIDRVDNVGAYVVKYMNKDNQDIRLLGKKCWFASEGLKKPMEITDEKEIDQIVGRLGHHKIYEIEFENEYTGKTKYQQFNLKRNVDEDKDKK